MKNYQYVLDTETPFIKKLYDKEDDYKVELLTPYGILEELKKLQEENADLEAKLADKELLKKQLNEQIWLCEEKQQTIDEINKEFTKAVKDWKHLVKIEKTEKEQLKQQLAEKETEIKSLSSEISSLEQDLTHYKGEVYNLKDQVAEKEKLLKKYLATSCPIYQDKISFAVEKLEKVRSFAYNTFKEFGCFDETDLEHILDNQIEELKKELNK